MKTQDVISIRQLCTLYDVPDTFLDSLCRYDLLEVVVLDDEKYIHKSRIGNIEKLMRLHYELEINIEGLDVILNLLDQIQSLQQEVTELKNKLACYGRE